MIMRCVALGLAGFLAACDPPQPLVFCEENGEFTGTIFFREDGFLVGETIIPYDEPAFEECTTLGTLVFGEAPISDAYFPNVRLLGGMVADPTEPNNNLVGTDVVEGFETVTDLGVLNSVKVVIGFNNVVRANSVTARDILGFASLEEVGHLETGRADRLTRLQVAGEVSMDALDRDLREFGVPLVGEITYGLPALRTVDRSLDVSSEASFIQFPLLESVGEDLNISSNGNARGLGDMLTPESVSVGRNLILRGNARPNNNAYYESWVDRNVSSVAGLTIITTNGQ
jgi:hypothetical protein